MGIKILRTLLVPLIRDMEHKMEATILENQIENEMDTGVKYQDLPCSLNWGYIVPNSRYLSLNRG